MPTAVRPNLHAKSANRAGTSSARTNPSSRLSTARPAPLQLVPAQKPPRKLALLLKLRKISTPTAVILTLAALPIYGWSVSTQLSWGKRYQHLEQLRREERHYQTETETLKHDLTQNAMQNPAGLMPQGPNNNLFLPAMPSRPNVPVVTTPPVQPNPSASVPLAY
jgi:hypothetical protein